MDFFTHLVIGMSTALVTLRKFDEEFILLGIIMSILPDADIFLIPFNRKFKKYYLSHRGGSHSYIIGFITALIVATIFKNVYNGSFIDYFIIGWLFYGLHVTCDLITTSRIPIFYPLSKREYRFNVERAVNPLLMCSSFFITFFSIWMVYKKISWSFRYFFRTMVFIVYYVYLFYKLMLKIIVQSLLQQNQIYIPGLLPIVYYIYEKRDFKNYIKFRLMKKVLLIQLKILIFESLIYKNSPKYELIRKSLELSKKYRFFSKWNCYIPFIIEQDSIIKSIILLSESFGGNRAYSLLITYDNNKNTIIDYKDGFFKVKNLLQR